MQVGREEVEHLLEEIVHCCHGVKLLWDGVKKNNFTHFMKKSFDFLEGTFCSGMPPPPSFGGTPQHFSVSFLDLEIKWIYYYMGYERP
jgi:hypothetical protein